MPGKYRISASYVLSTEVEPEGRLGGVEDAEGVQDYEDQSSFNREDVIAHGGEVVFEVEADSEDDAQNMAQDAMDSAHYSGDGYFEWEIENWEIMSVEEIVPPMDLNRAIGLIQGYLEMEVAAGRMDALTREAIQFVIEKLLP